MKCPRCNESECTICPECDEPSCGFCECENTETRQTVWVVEIPLADSIMAVGTTEANALRGAAIRALEYLNNVGAGVDRKTDEYWTTDTLVQYFGYRSTECELDGIGERQ